MPSRVGSRSIARTWISRGIPMRSSFGLSSLPVRFRPRSFHPTLSQIPLPIDMILRIVATGALDRDEVVLIRARHVVVVRGQRVPVGCRWGDGDHVAAAAVDCRACLAGDAWLVPDLFRKSRPTACAVLTPTASALPSSSSNTHGMTGRVASAYRSASVSCSSTERSAGISHVVGSHARSIVGGAGVADRGADLRVGAGHGDEGDRVFAHVGMVRRRGGGVALPQDLSAERTISQDGIRCPSRVSVSKTSRTFTNPAFS